MVGVGSRSRSVARPRGNELGKSLAEHLTYKYLHEDAKLEPLGY